MKYKYIFWDWNGTLFNDAGSALAAVNAMLTSRDLPNITIEQYRECIDVPIIRFYEKVMDMSKESMESLSVEFNSLWAKKLPEYPLSEGVAELLPYLFENGIKQYIFSSSQNKFIEPYLEKFSISNYFTAVLGATDCYVGSKVERTRKYLSDNNISPSQSLFIGDMVHDSDVAAEIGSDCILVSSGHQCTSALASTGREVISSLTELTQHI